MYHPPIIDFLLLSLQGKVMDRTDEELISDYCQGDEEAFSELVERHLKGVYSFVLRFVGDAQEAEDVVQETFLKAWKSAKMYKKESSRFKTWILRIARNSAIDFLRKRKHVPFSEFDTEDGQNIFAETIPDPTPLADEIFAKGQDGEVLNQAILKLPLETREVLVLHYTNGLTFGEIGNLLNQPQNTIKSRHHRALQSLRKLLPSSTPSEL